MNLKYFFIATLIFCFLLVFFGNYHVSAQETEILKKRMYLGFGFSLGIYNPGEVNYYLEDYWEHRKWGYMVLDEQGTPKMSSNFDFMFYLKYYITDAIEVKSVSDFGWSPKLLTFNDETNYFAFNRSSYGLIANYHLRFGNSKRYSFYGGGGAFLHTLKFKDHSAGKRYEAKSPGFRINAGLNLNFRYVEISPFLAYDFIIPAKGGVWITRYNETRNMMLDYSGGIIGFNFAFGLF